MGHFKLTVMVLLSLMFVANVVSTTTSFQARVNCLVRIIHNNLSLRGTIIGSQVSTELYVVDNQTKNYYLAYYKH